MNSTEGKQQHILIVCQYFYPEQFRINDIALEWVNRGYKVTVLTGIPNYPQGKFYDGYGWFKGRKENWNGVEIIRIPLIARGKTPIGLIMNYYSFPISGFFWNLMTKISADYVFMFETSPMNQCKIGVRYAKKHKVPCYLYVQDLWPENVEIVTGIHNKLIINSIDRMVRKIYAGCTHIFATSPSFVKMIEAKTDTPVSYWPQYAEEFYIKMDKQPREGDEFRIVFTGNIGRAQGLEILPETARILQNDKNCKVKFVIVGDGRAKDAFRAKIEETGTKDMFTLMNRLPAKRIPGVLSCCDMGFISFENKELWTNTIPAKLQSYMACGIPVLASAGGETERIIKEAECGICSPLGDAQALADAIRQAYSISEADLEKMGYNGSLYCNEHFNKDRLMEEMTNGYFTIL